MDTLSKAQEHNKLPHGRNKTSSNNQEVYTKCDNKHEPTQVSSLWSNTSQMHFTKVCRTNAEESSNYKKTKTVSNIETEVDSLHKGMVCSNNSDINGRWKNLTIKDVPVTFELNTGADANVLPKSVYEKLPGAPQLQPKRLYLQLLMEPAYTQMV